MRALITWLLALTAACGYQHGFAAGERLGIRTVAIHTVENETYRQGLDVRLTQRLGRDLNQYTGLVPGSPGSADADLRVRLREVQGRPISEGAGGAVVEGAVLLAVEVHLVDRRTGRDLYSGKHTDWAEFRAPVGENLASALDEAVADLSRKILTAIDRRFPE